jgi:hypothetical protein
MCLQNLQRIFMLNVEEVLEKNKGFAKRLAEVRRLV